jgi:hypothetical protein
VSDSARVHLAQHRVHVDAAHSTSPEWLLCSLASGPLPDSAMAMVRGVRRVHLAAGLTFAPAELAKHVLKGMLREYVRIHKVDAVCPDRKCAFPHEVGNNVLLRLLNVADGASYKGRHVSYDQYKWLSARACFEVLTETGNRGDESRRFTYSSLVWKRRGCIADACSAAWLVGGSWRRRLAQALVVQVRPLWFCLRHHAVVPRLLLGYSAQCVPSAG